MDFMLVAFAVDLALYALAGYLLVRFGKRFLPGPFQDPRITVLAFVVIGAFITMISFPHWAIYPD
jgi:hypothetical protein